MDEPQCTCVSCNQHSTLNHKYNCLFVFFLLARFFFIFSVKEFIQIFQFWNFCFKSLDQQRKTIYIHLFKYFQSCSCFGGLYRFKCTFPLKQTVTQHCRALNQRTFRPHKQTRKNKNSFRNTKIDHNGRCYLFTH